MDRKKTILIAVMINAGLIAVLFVTAIVMQDDPIVAEPQHHWVETNRLTQPLFEEEKLFDPFEGKEPLAKVQEEKTLPKPEELPLHQLPKPILTSDSSAMLIPEKHPFSSALEVTVKKGDSLEKVARKYHTTVDEIMKLNHLPSSFLKVGQVLKIPHSKESQEGRSHPVVKVDTVQDYYVIKVGDNPWTIAMKNHMKVEELLKLNGLNEERARKLKPGDRLRIR